MYPRVLKTSVETICLNLSSTKRYIFWSGSASIEYWENLISLPKTNSSSSSGDTIIISLGSYLVIKAENEANGLFSLFFINLPDLLC